MGDSRFPDRVPLKNPISLVKKKFDCVEMKRNVQQRIYRETRELSPKEEIEHDRCAAAEFWKKRKARHDR